MILNTNRDLFDPNPTSLEHFMFFIIRPTGPGQAAPQFPRRRPRAHTGRGPRGPAKGGLWGCVLRYNTQLFLSKLHTDAISGGVRALG